MRHTLFIWISWLDFDSVVISSFTFTFVFSHFLSILSPSPSPSIMTLEKLILQATDESLLGEENWDLTMQIVDKLDAKPDKQVLRMSLMTPAIAFDTWSHTVLS